MAPEINARQQRALTLFNYGNDAALKNNFDYAVQMYQEACKLDPEELRFRVALRGVTRRKFENNPAKVGWMVGTKTGPIKLRAQTARAQSKWAHVIEVCEEAFVVNPWDVEVAKLAAEAAEELGVLRLAQWFLESVQNVADKAEFFRALAAIHEKNKDWQKAIVAFERVKKIDPTDEVANRKINALSADATIHKSGGYGEASRRNLTAGNSGPEAEEVATPEELRRQQLSPEDRLRLTIKEDPTRVGPYLELAETLKYKGLLDDAEQSLAQGLKAVPGDPVLQSVYTEIQLLRLRRAVEGWSKRAEKDPNDAAARAKLDQLTLVLNDYETKDLRRRMTQRPDDVGLHLELGKLFARQGKHDEAIGEFQKARTSPAHKVHALHNAGLSFEANGAMKLAERNFDEALRGVDPEDMATFNALHYRLGRISESQGNIQKAEDHYNEVAANDYGYLDVAQRLRALNSPPSS